MQRFKFLLNLCFIRRVLKGFLKWFEPIRDLSEMFVLNSMASTPLKSHTNKLECRSRIDKNTLGMWNTLGRLDCSIQERRWTPIFFNSETKWPDDIEGQGQWPSFSIPVGRIPRCIFGANLVILAQIYYKLSHGQGKIPRSRNSLGKKDKMILNVKVNDPNFRYQLTVSPEACLVRIWWFQLKSQTIYHAGKIKFTHGQTEDKRQTDRHRQRQYPFGLKGHGIKMICHKYVHKCTRINKNE